LNLFDCLFCCSNRYFVSIIVVANTSEIKQFIRPNAVIVLRFVCLFDVRLFVYADR
jgi:hypothetical protein